METPQPWSGRRTSRKSDPRPALVVVFAGLSAVALAIAVLAAAMVPFEGVLGGVPASVLQLVVLWVAILAALFLLFVLLAYLDVLPHRGSVVEDIFLLHKSGILICHYSATPRAKVDSDLPGEKLGAARDFAAGTMKTKDGALQQLRYGDHRVHMAHGRHTALVVFARGGSARHLAQRMQMVLGNIEALYEKILESWSGRTEDFEAIDQILLELVES